MDGWAGITMLSACPSRQVDEPLSRSLDDRRAEFCSHRAGRKVDRQDFGPLACATRRSATAAEPGIKLNAPPRRVKRQPVGADRDNPRIVQHRGRGQGGRSSTRPAPTNCLEHP